MLLTMSITRSHQHWTGHPTLTHHSPYDDSALIDYDINFNMIIRIVKKNTHKKTYTLDPIKMSNTR